MDFDDRGCPISRVFCNFFPKISMKCEMHICSCRCNNIARILMMVVYCTTGPDLMPPDRTGNHEKIHVVSRLWDRYSLQNPYFIQIFWPKKSMFFILVHFFSNCGANFFTIFKFSRPKRPKNAHISIK